jgi:hypothetical protein
MERYSSGDKETMKYLSIILLILFPTFLFAGSGSVSITLSGTAGASGGGGCTWGSGDSAIFDTTTKPNSIEGNDIDASNYYAGSFILAANKTITGFKVNLNDVNQTGSVICSLYTAGAGSPAVRGTIIADTSVTVAASGITDYPSSGIIDFVLSTPKTGFLASAKYFVSCVGTGTTPAFQVISADPWEGGYSVDDNGSATDVYCVRMAVYGCNP